MQLLTAHLAVQAAWPEPYSWARNNVSDLGAVSCGMGGDAPQVRYVCSPLHDLMNVSFALEGVLLTAGAALLTSLWPRRGRVTAWLGGALLLVQGLGWIVIGLAPSDTRSAVHGVGALLLAVGNGGLIALAAGASGGPLRALRLSALVAGAVGLTASLLYSVEADLGLGLGGMERLWVFAVLVWTTYAGARLLLAPTAPPPPAQPQQEPSTP
ncbi:DUF998 domain-containing protein [Streptomonospora nanhaiensis]|uniref:Putative membrane protein n=1 Tax=Streptomonospora nanhaiensis TaxID=1323731 RepID=A0A853BIP7_9ACTN|nr:DUF998 domain-containing protein [Streptomonospora nanhaiensis]MBV2363011.1 DUF998 domain-containing protein [Streptomonospora nanhaiensis]MBX9387057.1 DUF998 domain-containing protein [Streptomonospora nanhaiensis]NYI95378.1 putative membrane protein [Streptomonospora nanhaiensis]